MNFTTVVAAAIMLLLFGFIGYWLVSFVRHPYRSLGRNKATGAVGSMLEDLDRLLARPSTEHKIEVENKIQKRDDDIGGE